MRPNRFLDAALWLAHRGMHVFPLRPGTKLPAVRTDWDGCATTDAAQIRRWWGEGRPGKNVAIATGRSGLLVVDLDKPKKAGDPNGREVLEAAAACAGATVPTDTMTVSTPGGLHLYFRAPSGTVLTNTAGRIGPSVDTRAVGGYVVAPGSIVARVPYRLMCVRDPAPAPQWLLDALRPRRPAMASQDRSRCHPAYVRAALDGEARRVAEAGVGRRNHVLFTAAARLARFVRSGHLREADVHAALAIAADRHVGTAGFTETEVRRTVQSGLRSTADRSCPHRADSASGRDVRPHTLES